MLMKTSIKDVDRLIDSLSSILSKDHCSFSEEEQIILSECIEQLEEFKTLIFKGKEVSTLRYAELATKILQLLTSFGNLDMF